MSNCKCPSCKAIISELVALPINANDGAKSLKAAVYACPTCKTILSAGADPYAMAQEIANNVLRHLKSH